MQFKEILSKLQRNSDEENFNEAKALYYYAKKEKLYVLTPEVEEIFEIIKNKSLNELFKSSNCIMSNFFAVWKAIF